jgi:hypothetical protein
MKLDDIRDRVYQILYGLKPLTPEQKVEMERLMERLQKHVDGVPELDDSPFAHYFEQLELMKADAARPFSNYGILEATEIE